MFSYKLSKFFASKPVKKITGDTAGGWFETKFWGRDIKVSENRESGCDPVNCIVYRASSRVCECIRRSSIIT